MKLLLDTHVVLWALGEPKRLRAESRALLTDASVELGVSAATAWEIAIKSALGKLRIPGTVAAWFLPAVAELGAGWLDITAADASAVEALPLHHRDPFDRMLVAQAVAGGWTIVTADDRLAAYDVSLLRA